MSIFQAKRIKKELDAQTENSNNNNKYVYVLSNPMYVAYGDDVYKIGHSKDPEERSHDFDTSYLEPSTLVYTYRHVNAPLLEQRVHKALDMFRMASNREFFKCELHIIKDIICYLAKETYEKPQIKMKPIPLPIQFIQFYIEQYQCSTPWETKHEFKYKDLYNIFTEFLHEKGLRDIVTFNSFRDFISKDLNIKLFRRDRSNRKDIKYYTLGASADDVINFLKQKGLYTY